MNKKGVNDMGITVMDDMLHDVHTKEITWEGHDNALILTDFI